MIKVHGGGKLDVLGVIETHWEGCGVWECRSKNKEGLWDGFKGVIVWTGAEKGRVKEGCTYCSP